MAKSAQTEAEQSEAQPTEAERGMPQPVLQEDAGQGITLPKGYTLGEPQVDPVNDYPERPLEEALAPEPKASKKK